MLSFSSCRHMSNFASNNSILGKNSWLIDALLHYSQNQSLSLGYERHGSFCFCSTMCPMLMWVSFLHHALINSKKNSQFHCGTESLYIGLIIMSQQIVFANKNPCCAQSFSIFTSSGAICNLRACTCKQSFLCKGHNWM